MFKWLYRLFKKNKTNSKKGLFREPIVAWNRKTGHKIILYTHADAIRYGFNLSSIGLCLNRMQNKHKGYIFNKKSHKPIKINYSYQRYL